MAAPNNAKIASRQMAATGQASGITVPAIFTDASPTSTPTPCNGNKIAFVSNRDFDGNLEVYVMNANGSNQTRLTSNSGRNEYPSFSGDGSKIAFTSDRDGNSNDEIYVMDANGSNQTRLTNNPADDFEPSFSGDGSKIAFVSRRDDGTPEIYIMDANGSNQTRLTNSTLDFSPSISGDGSKIAFVSYRDGGNAKIYIMDANDSNQTRLTNNPADDYSPYFSVDCTKSAFVQARRRRRDLRHERQQLQPNPADQ